jgi:CDP-2,3-bis-(O-geranylgeranyl)-sn-glycerol synthase
VIDAWEIGRLLYFFAPAYLGNMSPALVKRWFTALAVPIDGGHTLGGRRILGDHKTWRGLLAGIVVGAVVFELQRLAFRGGLGRSLALIDYSAHPFLPGAIMGFAAGVGDAIKSFFKRRIGIPPGKSWFPFDQLDFLVAAYVFVSVIWVPPLLLTLASVPVILVGHVVITTIGYWLGLKEAWI